MSATRDKSQKTTFVYSNLYQIYRQGKEAALTKGIVIKPENIKDPLAVRPFRPAELLGKRIELEQATRLKEEQNRLLMNFQFISTCEGTYKSQS